MAEAYEITMPPGGWTVDDLDSHPDGHVFRVSRIITDR